MTFNAKFMFKKVSSVQLHSLKLFFCWTACYKIQMISRTSGRPPNQVIDAQQNSYKGPYIELLYLQYRLLV